MVPGHSHVQDDDLALRITADEIVRAWPEAVLGSLGPNHQQWRGSSPREFSVTTRQL
jgi:hypothetical protein